MGIYDRDYGRDTYNRPPGVHLGGTWSLTTKIVVFTFCIYGVQLFFRDKGRVELSWFTDLFALHANWFQQPWKVFELLTYGFLHSTDDLWHILFNMFLLWMFGRAVEQRYGQREYLLFYLVAIIFAGICWNLTDVFADGNSSVSMLGASGGIAAVLILFAFSFPHQKLLFMFVIPMPAWLFAVVMVLLDLLGASNRSGESNVAYTAHLGGALFGFLYFWRRWHFSKFLSGNFSLPKLRRRPRLRVHDPRDAATGDSETEVDDILRKIQQHGQNSLTNRERQILQQASREYQQKRTPEQW